VDEEDAQEESALNREEPPPEEGVADTAAVTVSTTCEVEDEDEVAADEIADSVDANRRWMR